MTNKQPGILDWDAIENEIAESNRRSYDSVDHDALKAKAEAERQRRIKAGWEDEEGNSLIADEENDNEEEDEDDEAL